MKLGSFFTGGITPGTVRGEKAIVPNSSKAVDTLDVTTLKLGGVTLSATAAELNTIVGGGATGNKKYSNAIPAAAGNSQGTGTALTADINLVTGADGTKGVVLPTAVDGYSILVVNTDAAAVLKVYPATGGTINALAANGAFSVGPGREARFEATSATQWYTDSVAAGTATVTELNLLAGVTATTAELNIVDGVTATAAELNYNDIATLGTGAASKAVVLDAGDDYTWPATGILTYGVLKDSAATTLVATAAELNRAADVSTRLVAAGGTLAVTEALHDGKTILLDTLTGSVCTLPAATGSGARFRFVVSVVPTSNSHIVKVANVNDTMAGLAYIAQDAADTTAVFETAATSDTITLNASTTGGTQLGECIEVEDIRANVWAVIAHLAGTGTEATPFSATV